MRNKVIVLCVITVCIVALDQYVKAQLGGYPQGSVVGSLLFGLVDLRIVYNTGAAWGVFAGNPTLLGAFSLLVCVLLLGYFAWAKNNTTMLQIVGMGLIVGGGIANAIDRFAQGYVLDYLAVTFIDFPVFNIADMGITCGVIILVISLFVLPPTAHDQKSECLEASTEEALEEDSDKANDVSDKTTDGASAKVADVTLTDGEA